MYIVSTPHGLKPASVNSLLIFLRSMPDNGVASPYTPLIAHALPKNVYQLTIGQLIETFLGKACAIKGDMEMQLHLLALISKRSTKN